MPIFTKDIKSGDCMLCDAGSTNGTYVNNIKLNLMTKRPFRRRCRIVRLAKSISRYYTPEGCYDLLKQMPG